MSSSHVVAYVIPPYDEVVYDRLIELARAGKPANYTDFFGGRARARSIARRKLEPICELEHRAGRPILTTVVVGRATRVPGKPFFDWVAGHDEAVGSCVCGARIVREGETRRKLIDRLQAEVYRYWALKTTV